MSTSVIILCHNEEKHIARAIRSVASFAATIYVVDSYSTDRTCEIARNAGAVVLQNSFVNYAKQFQWALNNAPISTDWVMRLDADEIVEPDLAATIACTIPSLPPDVVGINLKRKHIFMGRWIRHGGRYPLILLRIWRHGHGQIEDRWMDEHMIVSGGRTVTFEGGFTDHNLNDLSFFIEKHNRYATREAIDVLNSRYSLFQSQTIITAKSTSLQASVKRGLKEKMYNRVPFQLGALGYFLFRYVAQLGFLDGKEGLIYHVLQGFWYRFLVGAKVVELEKAVAHLRAPQPVRDELARITGLKLS